MVAPCAYGSQAANVVGGVEDAGAGVLGDPAKFWPFFEKSIQALKKQPVGWQGGLDKLKRYSCAEKRKGFRAKGGRLCSHELIKAIADRMCTEVLGKPEWEKTDCAKKEVTDNPFAEAKSFAVGDPEQAKNLMAPLLEEAGRLGLVKKLQELNDALSEKKGKKIKNACSFEKNHWFMACYNKDIENIFKKICGHDINETCKGLVKLSDEFQESIKEAVEGIETQKKDFPNIQAKLNEELKNE